MIGHQTENLKLSDDNRPRFVRSADHEWQGLYIGYTLFIDGHDIRPTDVLDALKIHYNEYTIPDDYAEELGNLPNNFLDLDENKLSES